MEGCVEYVSSAVNAEKGGAIRLELCSALSEGGLTPSLGLFKIIKSKVQIPIFVMIRPRTGNDFIYDEAEISIMEEDIKVFVQNGADGFVFGALTRDFKVDTEVCSRLLKLTDCKPVTFHRAFDMVPNPEESLETIIRLGFKRILTSGQAPSAEKGTDLLKKLNRLAGDRLTIMPGCGVNPGNLEGILAATGVREFHGTAREKLKLPLPKASVSLGHNEDESVILITSVARVQEMVKISKKFIP